MTAPLATIVAEIQDIQPPLLAALLFGGCAGKLTRTLRTGSLAEGLGPTEFFPLRLRRPLSILLCIFELSLGIALVVTALPAATFTWHADITQAVKPVLSSPAATGARLAAAAFFLTGALALAEMRGRHPEAGCGCFGDLSRQPSGIRSIVRAVFLAVLALVSVGSHALYLPPRSHGALLFGALLAAEVLAIAIMSPEVGEALVRLGYSEPCELRLVPAERSLASLRRSRPWRGKAGLITQEMPADVWRELCWRYVVFPGMDWGAEVDVVFAVQVKARRPVILSAVVPRTGPGGPDATVLLDSVPYQAMQLPEASLEFSKAV